MKSVWRGALSFGLVNIPVRLYHASIDHEIKFHLLHKKDLSRIRYSRICESDGKEVAWEDVVKGYEVGKGRFVVFNDDDFEKANPRKVKTIEIDAFVREDEIDGMYYEMPYYLEPEKGAAKAYRLLAAALAQAGKVGIGTFVFRNKEHLGFIKPYGNALVLIQLRFSENLLKPDGLDLPKREPLLKKDIDLAVQFIRKLTKKFNPKEYRDTYAKEVKRLIQKKGKGVPIKKAKEAPAPKVKDIMELLKKSMRRKSA
ncbi:MAG: Ku protein [Parachlamydiales bacterium]|nr:Ku protein [Parachlamydiales bacterium]